VPSWLGMAATAALPPLTRATAAITGRSFFMGRIVLTARRPNVGNHPRSNTPIFARVNQPFPSGCGQPPLSSAPSRA
jgi:hypothetical protein